MPRIDDGRERAAFLGRAVGRRPAHPAVTHPKKTLRAKAAHPACLRFAAGCLRCARRAGTVPARSAASRPGGGRSFRPVRPFVRQPLRSAAQAERGAQAMALPLSRRWVRAGEARTSLRRRSPRQGGWQ
ncbi:hypothetical protein [Acidovorax sp. BLS4]|uniref:hypothetical protein n=1 Tax=Acidovorax sp. BLS4 TaxID=3273430 RepID=UPI0029431C05|nr:hypothetical protein [Paracidovorax avenae]WOI44446.1 hypothetical protein R1Z03_18190 [Paracidovorax avenae]